MITLRVGSAIAEPGSKAQGAIEIGRCHDGSSVIIPVILVNGVRDGPTLVVQAATHGSEYPGIEAIWRLAQFVDPAQTSGRVIAIPIVNVPAFTIDRRCNDVDYQDLNRVFPGNSDGTLTERTAHRLVTDVISQADCLIDLHAASEGQIVRVAMAYAGYEASTLELAKASGFSFIWIADRLGANALGPAAASALARGIPTTLLEAGSGREYRLEDARALHDAVLNIMRHQRMLEGVPSKPTHRVTFKSNAFARVGVAGFYRPAVEAGQRVHKEELIASVRDVYDRELQRIEAAGDGLICLLNKRRSVRIGDQSHLLGEILTEERCE